MASCGSAFTSDGDSDGCQAGPTQKIDASPQPVIEAGPDREAPKESGVTVNPNATISCSTEQCKPGRETCCMQNSNNLPDFCVGGSGQPTQCASDKATVTVLECDDGEDCALAGKPGTVCCAQARTFDIDPSIPVWAAIRCLAPSSCRAPDSDVFCGQNGADCPPGKTCTKSLGPYTYCQ